MKTTADAFDVLYFVFIAMFFGFFVGWYIVFLIENCYTKKQKELFGNKEFTGDEDEQ